MPRRSPEEQTNYRMRRVLDRAIITYNNYREKLQDDPTPAAKEKERLLRGIVRGAAMMKHARDRPSDINQPNYNELILKFERLYGLEDQ